jgi:ABC-type nitrate/sulfonate/bicarbonate transport system permease component
MSGRTTYLALELLTPVAIVGAIWLVSRDSTSIYLPPLSTILTAFVQHWIYGDGLYRDVAPSLSRMFLGFFIAAPIGIVMGLALGRSPRLREAFDPLLEFMRAIPPAALLPVAITLFGIGTEMKVTIIALACVWPVLINTAAGARSIDVVLLDTASVFRLGPITRLFRIVLPAASPQIAAGLRTSLAFALIMVLISELVASTEGVGYFVLQSQRSFAIADMWSGVILLGLIGIAINAAFLVVERKLLKWDVARNQVS